MSLSYCLELTDCGALSPYLVLFSLQQLSETRVVPRAFNQLSCELEMLLGKKIFEASLTTPPLDYDNLSRITSAALSSAIKRTADRIEKIKLEGFGNTEELLAEEKRRLKTLDLDLKELQGLPELYRNRRVTFEPEPPKYEGMPNKNWKKVSKKKKKDKPKTPSPTLIQNMDLEKAQEAYSKILKDLKRHIERFNKLIEEDPEFDSPRLRTYIIETERFLSMLEKKFGQKVKKITNPHEMKDGIWKRFNEVEDFVYSLKIDADLTPDEAEKLLEQLVNTKFLLLNQFAENPDFLLEKEKIFTYGEIESFSLEKKWFREEHQCDNIFLNRLMKKINGIESALNVRLNGLDFFQPDDFNDDTYTQKI